MSTANTRWQAVIPLKNLVRAKSRLDLPPQLRRDLAVAFARDVIAACRGCRLIAEIVVVTDNSWRGLIPSDVTIRPDNGTGLNEAITTISAAATMAPMRGVIMGDLPCATSGEVTSLLQAAPARQWSAVADHSTLGTTVLLGPATGSGPIDRWTHTRFGPRSFDAHVLDGAGDLTFAAGPGLRWDVDSPADLDQAVRLGVGPNTAAVLRGSANGWPG